ncbi:8-amino-7-oxononanoate synthase [Ideonella dechloratans]|uniref:8-amino-7-oxononanoate synthase n=1 Tax=Ideonella dechloratans TaxID=36863 RepID=A0A643FER7_IDEDE|nr:8-amino-7-oxononanoate synthase [Ideonella dechloratans]KAB0583627.1 8-amino-7-oxononanoate synthase [Ideonella dechloratans]UFU11142.1 8-amino-7-oxononanoate synthase [Ideonella dechloratans]
MSWLDEFSHRLNELEAQHLLRQRRVVTPLPGALMRVDGQAMLAFCSNDYLGLAADASLAEAVQQALPHYGVGSGASPMVSGHTAANAALEEELADFVQLPRALYFYAGFATNVGVIPALVGLGDEIFADRLNHASLIDGSLLSRARMQRYRHADLDHLTQMLQASEAKRKLIISDAVFSMDGDVADIPGLLALAEEHDALLLLDDAHGLGVMGPQGRGALAAAGLTGANASRRILYMSTLSKAVGVAGGFVAGDATLVEWVLQKARSYTFATAAPALLAEAIRPALRRIAQGDALRDQLHARILQLRRGLTPAADSPMASLGWSLMPSDTAIQPLVVGQNAVALALTDALRQRGLWVPAIRPPTVPVGTARLRIALSAAHTEADVDRLLEALHALAAEQFQAVLRAD